jgi:hypothetical protein
MQSHEQPVIAEQLSGQGSFANPEATESLRVFRKWQWRRSSVASSLAETPARAVLMALFILITKYFISTGTGTTGTAPNQGGLAPCRQR